MYEILGGEELNTRRIHEAQMRQFGEEAAQALTNSLRARNPIPSQAGMFTAIVRIELC